MGIWWRRRVTRSRLYTVASAVALTQPLSGATRKPSSTLFPLTLIAMPTPSLGREEMAPVHRMPLKPKIGSVDFGLERQISRTVHGHSSAVHVKFCNFGPYSHELTMRSQHISTVSSERLERTYARELEQHGSFTLGSAFDGAGVPLNRTCHAPAAAVERAAARADS